MKIQIIQSNGDSVMFDARVVHINNYCSIADRHDNIQYWSNPIQHKKVNQKIEIIISK